MTNKARFNPFFGSRPVAEPTDRNTAAPTFHRGLPFYSPTPLVDLPNLARELGVARLIIKDESSRFGLNAFKVLGTTYALYRFLEGRGVGKPRASAFTFVTATDGNHGRALAWSARRVRQRAVVYVPNGTTPARLSAIESEGAEVVEVEGDYDAAVRQVAHDADRNGWHVIADVGYPGYEEVPRWIVAGYHTLFSEIDVQLRELGLPFPDHVIVQAGVGGLACAAARYLGTHDPATRPQLVVVEPTRSCGLYESITTPHGSPVAATGDQRSIMAGLNCGMPSLTAWPWLRRTVDCFLAIDDVYAERAVRLFAQPPAGDPVVTAGESGAAGLAGVLALTGDATLQWARAQMVVDRTSNVLVINTEGITDPVNHERILATRSRPEPPG